MHQHLSDISDLLDNLITNKRPYGKGPDDDVCNRRQEFAETAVRGKLLSLRLPPVATRCITEVDMQLSNQQQSRLWRDKLAFVEASKLAGLSAVKKMNRTNWNGKAYPHAHFSYSDHIDSCQLLHNVGFRISGQWAVMLSVSQFPMALQRRDRRREYHVEYLTLANGTVGNVLVTLPRFDDGVLVNDTTTTWENWRASPASSIFRTVAPLSENPAIAAALQEKSEWREQVEDSRTPSNIAILTLTCLFTLLPVASFADVSLLELTAYTIATDIVTCVPLAIKGVELLLANRVHRKTVLWAYGDLNAKPNDSLVVESWSAACSVKSNVRQLGVGLLACAVVFMGLGVAFELLARARLKRRKADLTARRLREYNEQHVRWWTTETPCPQCSCYGQLTKRMTPVPNAAPLQSRLL